MMMSLKVYVEKPRTFLVALIKLFGSLLSDSLYLHILYFLETRERLHLKEPRTFSEKIQWLKLYNRKPEYTMMVDKYAVKEYVTEVIGKEYVIPTLGVWDRPEDIFFDDLPQQFVLKTTHGGGSVGVIVCNNKNTINRTETVKRLKRAMKQNIYKQFREWPYKNVKPRIIAEKNICINGNLRDYKFFCFHGDAKYCQVISDREHEMTIDFFDRKWNHMPFHEPKGYAFSKMEISPPQQIEKMWLLSERLSMGIPFLRVDFYETNGRLYFGELTFFPTSGMGGFEPSDWDIILGNYIHLPRENEHSLQ